MKKVIAYVDDNGNLYDSSKSNTTLNVSSYVWNELEESVDVAKLMSLGATTDDLLKLKASEII